jgi:hypothetical protein
VPSNCSISPGGTLVRAGHNLELGKSCVFDIDADPEVAALADNGGPTKTMALTAGSPAIDAGDDAACPATDQRGVPRPQGPHCDIGAYEVVVGTTTTSTTLPGCAAVATYESIDCRLDELVASLDAAQDLGRLKTGLVKAATKARTKKQQAEGFVATGKQKKQKSAMKKAAKALSSFLHKLGSRSATKVPQGTRQMLTGEATPILADMKTLLGTL